MKEDIYMSKGFEYNQVIKQVSGLNSISTLKNGA